MQSMTLKLSVILLVIFCVVGVEHPASANADERPNSSNPVVRDATARAVRLIERTSAEFLKTHKCFTCHTQTFGAMVLSDARKLGYQVDAQNLSRQVERVSEVDSSLKDGSLRVDTVGHALWTMDIGQRVADRVTEKMTAYLLSYQKDLGHWEVTVDRPPAEASEASNFTTNYVAIRGLSRYGTEEQRQDIVARTAAVREWMRTAKTSSTEDEVFRLRLAKELATVQKTKDSYVKDLLAKQHASGGWSQELDMKPDAYATGSVLVALHAAAGIPPDNPSWRRGLAYLLATQEPDGSWHVVTRAKPIQEYFESGFPHGKDQFISAFATGWATQALLISVRHDTVKADEQTVQPEPRAAPFLK
jgi:N-acyl-D-amino-acid deacylase